MASYKHRLFGIISNPPQGTAGHLPYLTEEQASLLAFFKKLEKHNDWNFHFELTDQWQEKDEIGQIAENIREVENQITVFHYSGHADHSALLLNNADLRTDTLIQQLQRCTRLDVLVLNGCSTQGFVKYVLEHTSIRAVIATDRPVFDHIAKVFSETFYSYLFDNTPLAEAFNMAQARALPNDFKVDQNIYKATFQAGAIVSADLLTDKKTGSTRGIKNKVNGFLGKDKDTPPWGLYTRSEAILDWKLLDPPPKDDSLAAVITGSIKEQNKKIIQLKVELKKKKTQLDPVKAALQAGPANPALDQVVKDMQKEIDTLEATLADMENHIRQQEKEQQDLSFDCFDQHIFQCYSQHLPKLNYLDQHTFINQLMGGPKQIFNGFVLHGSANCCLDHLSRNIQDWLSIRNNTETFHFDFGSGTLGDFWQEIRKRLLPGVAVNDHAGIAKGLFSNYLGPEGNTRINYLFMFRNIAGPAGNQLPRIIEFWKTLISQWGALQVASLQHRIYAFIIDSNCKVVDTPIFKTDRQDEYLTLLQSEASIGQQLSLLPVVQPLRQHHILDWESTFVQELNDRYDIATLNNILADTGGWFRTTVKAIAAGKLRLERNKARMQAIIHQIIEKT